VTQLAAILAVTHGAARRRRPAHVPTTELPQIHGRNYARLINDRLLVVMRGLVDRLVIPELSSIVHAAELASDSLTVDLESWATTLTEIISNVRIQMARAVSDKELAELIDRQVVSGVMVANNHLNRTQLRAILGVDILGADPQLRSLAAGFVAENVGLIKTIPVKYFDDIERIILRNVQSGRRAGEIESEIRKRWPAYSENAKLIAADQTAKLSSQITKKRHGALGITEYYWRDSGDDRVRPRHRKLGDMSRDGKIFAYKKPPIVDVRTGRTANPGEDFRCRCTAEPVIPGIDDPEKKTRRAPTYAEAKAQYFRERAGREKTFFEATPEATHEEFAKREKSFVAVFKMQHPEHRAIEKKTKAAEKRKRTGTRGTR